MGFCLGNRPEYVLLYFATLAAGGTLVRHNAEEVFWTLADPVGNEVDIATTSAPESAPA